MAEDSMTETAKNAREILGYCRDALEELRQDPTEQRWVVRWVAALALLRTVDEALKNVDAQISPAIRNARADWKRGLQNSTPLIYAEFIRGDTNRLLHQAKVVRVNRSDLVLPEAPLSIYLSLRHPTRGLAFFLNTSIQWLQAHSRVETRATSLRKPYAGGNNSLR
jgi:hypothetical protein